MWHNHKDVSIGSREFSGNSLNLQYLEPRSYGRNYASDEEETVSMPVFPSKKSLTTEVSDGWKSKRSKTEFTYSSTSSESEVNFATFDSTFLFTLSKDEERKQNFKWKRMTNQTLCLPEFLMMAIYFWLDDVLGGEIAYMSADFFPMFDDFSLKKKMFEYQYRIHLNTFQLGWTFGFG